MWLKLAKKSFYRINHHSMINPRFYVDGKRLFVRNVPSLKVRGKRAPKLYIPSTLNIDLTLGHT